MGTKKDDKEMDKRRLAVEDPVEMKTEEDSEMLVAATPEEHAEDADDETGERDRHGTPVGRMRRGEGMGVKGVGKHD